MQFIMPQVGLWRPPLLKKILWKLCSTKAPGAILPPDQWQKIALEDCVIPVHVQINIHSTFTVRNFKSALPLFPFQIESSQSGTLERKFFKRHRPSATSPSFINMREVSGRHRLPPGDYCIIPAAFEPNEEADFIVRVFSEKEGGLVWVWVYFDSQRGVKELLNTYILATEHWIATLGETSRSSIYLKPASWYFSFQNRSKVLKSWK